MTQATGTARAAVRIDGAAPLSPAVVRELSELCDLVEGPGGPGLVVLAAGGAPGPSRDGLTTSLVTKWERTLRRLERLPAVTVAVAAGNVGGPALDALLVADVRIAEPDARLVAGTAGAATWPGMALFRMAHQSGAAAVRRTVLFGAPVGAAEAVAAGLVDEMTADPDAAVAEAAARFGGFAGPELAIRRQLMFDAVTTGFEDALGAHLAACDRALRLEREAAS
ncbi:enoyl-CoA-hydratase DpgB [Actinomadura sp. WMMB 499]|uniref:enoyl-CoA-hydratase DpgB n=1 Tax=Actinomadura sp. WMMB 499 TaxID=1219491 RepID=UPI001248187C|nr:enoyl-CoA-hydratase DpgB [Actinomadura sp. WMMB 499]QFG21434.1 enoyl-CoA hydratase/isomerase family protein [Actinomadura sp. WMMB 499]